MGKGKLTTERNSDDMALLPLNILPLKRVAVLPNCVVRFKVGREISKLALQNAIVSHKKIALFTQIDEGVEVPGVDDLHPIGTLCELIEHPKLPLPDEPSVKVTVRGLKRVQVSKVIRSSPFLLIEPMDVTETNSKDDITLPPKKDIEQAVSVLSRYKPELKLDDPMFPIPYDAAPGDLADTLVCRSGGKYENLLPCLLELNPRRRLRLAYEVLIKGGQQAQLESEINERATQAIKDEHRQIFLRGQLKAILEELGENAPLGLHNPIFRGKSFKVDPKLSFVLMPFAEEFRPIYDEIVKPVVEQFGLNCVRADDLYGSKAIIEDIWKLINEAKIIIADVTGKNANVFYEIGLAHAVGKEVIIISQAIEHVPFDLRHLRCFIYRDSVAGFRRLESQLQQALSTIDGLTKLGPQG